MPPQGCPPTLSEGHPCPGTPAMTLSSWTAGRPLGSAVTVGTAPGAPGCSSEACRAVRGPQRSPRPRPARAGRPAEGRGAWPVCVRSGVCEHVYVCVCTWAESHWCRAGPYTGEWGSPGAGSWSGIQGGVRVEGLEEQTDRLTTSSPGGHAWGPSGCQGFQSPCPSSLCWPGPGRGGSCWRLAAPGAQAQDSPAPTSGCCF